jgi:hypothetical protein
MIALMTETIGKLLKQFHVDLIQERGHIVDQRELAEHFGIDYALFNKYYNDRRSPSDPQTLIKLARKLGPGIYDVLGLARPNGDVKALIQAYDNTPEERKRELLKVVTDWLKSLGVEVKDK